MPDAADHPAPDDPATDALQQVLRSMSYLMTRPSAHVWLSSRAGVSIGRSDVHLLDALARDGGSCRVGDLADRLLVEPSHVTRQVAGLQEQGLVERTPDPGDRRARNLTITPKGSDLLIQLRRIHLDDLRQALRDVDADDIDATVRVLRRLLERYAVAVRANAPAPAALPAPDAAGGTAGGPAPRG
ncbi:MarR family transcriptional regulator [Streptomyces sp. SL13]|uniref:MarR family transcriptional regulator n=1 Tax=Streptantibioticus silvisoli TaxID=2705255 RepID=A0AA90H9L2_9ACTN|nr:MarR family transcriptional regulator [Streptantibioticus silvisoli]MDI5961819.1 MarR family transcriptional regulator [Streptantibioticus silvisoli]MDI5973373.1 MarR family transcriptional regulator [Streptantibioticus silvisoli]